MRPKGTVVYDSTLTPNPIAEAAKQRQRELEAERRAAAEARASRPVPNRICYANAFAGWQPGMKLPCCNRCKANLYPEENHACPGYIPERTRIDMDIPFEQRCAMREAARDDWDDDQYDPTTEGDANFIRHEAETSETKDWVVDEHMDEETWLARRRQQLGLARDYEPGFDVEFDNSDNL